MNNALSNRGQQDNVDGQLRAFFAQEMPALWPDAKVPAPPRPAAAQRSWLRSWGRPALAASVAVILVSYLTLAGMFPAESRPGLNLNRLPMIGARPGLKQRVATPGGGEALLWEEIIPGTRPTIIINVQEIKGPQNR